MTDWTPEKGERFIRRLAETGNVSKAAEFARSSRQTAYTHRIEDAEFAAAWENALEQYVERLEAEADRRAVEGCVRKKFDRGAPVLDPKTQKQYEEREYSDTLLIFRLKALKPEKYRDNATITHEGNPQKPIAYIEVAEP